MNQDKLTQSPAPDSAKKVKLTIIIALVVVFSLALMTAIILQSRRQRSQQSTEAPESGLQTEDQLRDFKHEVTVVITAKGPSPQTLTISKDTRVNWENRDTIVHKLAITPGTTVPPLFDNQHQIELGGGYPYVIHQATMFHYYLVDHPNQGGEVIVK